MNKYIVKIECINCRENELKSCGGCEGFVDHHYKPVETGIGLTFSDGTFEVLTAPYTIDANYNSVRVATPSVSYTMFLNSVRDHNGAAFADVDALITYVCICRDGGEATGSQNLTVGERTETLFPLNISGGIGTALPAATTALIGLMTAPDKVKLNELGVLHFGSGVPSNGLGADKDRYLDVSTGKMYAKASGAWTLVYSPVSAFRGRFANATTLFAVPGPSLLQTAYVVNSAGVTGGIAGKAAHVYYDGANWICYSVITDNNAQTPQQWYDALPAHDSMEAAVLAGMTAGQQFKTTAMSQNAYALPKGVVITIE